MSCTNYEAVSDCVGHWLHRAQVSLLTGPTSQIKLSHIAATSEKTPGAGLVRAWCGLQEAAEPASLSRSPTDWVGAFDAPTSGDACEGVLCQTHQPRITRTMKLLRTAGMPRRTCEGALRKYNTPALRIRVTPSPKKTCLKDLSRATSRRSWTTER